jgi:hypothetical protein
MTISSRSENTDGRGFLQPTFLRRSKAAVHRGACSDPVRAVNARGMLPNRAFLSSLTLALPALLAVACAGTTPPPKTEVQETAPPVASEKSDVDVSAEVGGLNEEATGKVFQRAELGFDRCFKNRAKAVEYLSGTVRFFVVIDADRKAKSITVEESDLGDREAEKCMQAVLARMSWPKPVGGRTAHAHYTAAAFELQDPDVREPVDVPPEQVQKLRSKLKKQVSECTGSGPAPYRVTAYIDKSGKVITASVTSPDPAGELKLDCLVDLVKSAEFPSPGSYTGKVSFEL